MILHLLYIDRMPKSQTRVFQSLACVIGNGERAVEARRRIRVS
jgi:hypothetical protein